MEKRIMIYKKDNQVIVEKLDANDVTVDVIDLDNTITTMVDLETESDKPQSGNFDEIENPKHYNIHPSGVECVNVVQHMNYNTGNAIKYLWRKGTKEPTKEGTLKDLKKARFYVNKEIERVEQFE